MHREIRQRLTTQKEVCNKELRKIIHLITLFVEEKLVEVENSRSEQAEMDAFASAVDSQSDFGGDESDRGEGGGGGGGFVVERSESFGFPFDGWSSSSWKVGADCSTRLCFRFVLSFSQESLAPTLVEPRSQQEVPSNVNSSSLVWEEQEEEVSPVPLVVVRTRLLPTGPFNRTNFDSQLGNSTRP